MLRSLPYRILWVAIIVLQALPYALSQYGGPPVPFSCFRYFGMAENAASATGNNNDGLCATTGALWSLINTGQSCIGRAVTSVPAQGFDVLNVALQLCNEEVSGSVSSLCASRAAQDQPCSIQSSYFGQAIATPTASSITVTDTSTTAQVQSIPSTTLATSTDSSIGVTLVSTSTTTLFLTSTDTTGPVFPTDVRSLTPVFSNSTRDPNTTSFVLPSNPTPDTIPAVEPENGHKPSNGLIIGATIGGAIAFILLLVSFCLLHRHYVKCRKHSVPIVFQPLPPQAQQRQPRARRPRPAFPLFGLKQQQVMLEASAMSGQSTARGTPINKMIPVAATAPSIRTIKGLQELDSHSTSQSKETNSGVSPGPSLSPDPPDQYRVWRESRNMRTWYSSGTSTDGYEYTADA